MSVEGFKGMTEMERSSISNRSTNLFTLSAIKRANRALLRKRRRDEITEEERAFAAAFWTAVCSAMPDWRLAKERKLAPGHLRRKFVHAHGVALSAIATAGADLVGTCPTQWHPALRKLETVDWSRTNQKLWEGRAMTHGRISKAKTHIRLTANLLKMHMGLCLTAEEQALERILAANHD